MHGQRLADPAEKHGSIADIGTDGRRRAAFLVATGSTRFVTTRVLTVYSGSRCSPCSWRTRFGQPSPEERPAPEPPAESPASLQRQWYGWQTVLVDVASLGLGATVIGLSGNSRSGSGRDRLRARGDHARRPRCPPPDRRTRPLGSRTQWCVLAPGGHWSTIGSRGPRASCGPSLTSSFAPASQARSGPVRRIVSSSTASTKTLRVSSGLA